jgi:predicted dienelactone hydrolase
LRRFELILAGVCAASIVWPALFGIRSRRGVVFGATVAAVVAQLVLEGYRWQVFPLYMVALGLGFGDLFSMERKLPWWRRVSRPILGLIGLGMMTALAWALPVPVLPEPSGPLAVGTMTFELVFPERLEHYGPAPDTQPRRIMVQVWYPAEEAGNRAPGPWTADLATVGPALSRRLGLPGFFLSHTRYTQANSVPSASPLAGTFPLILYSHGWTGFRSIALNQMESLASHGYVVMAADHTYASISTRFPDGTVVEFDPNALPEADTVESEVYDQAALDLVSAFSDDLTGVIDAIGEGAAGPFGEISTHVDLGRIGVFGHSTGGGAALALCLADDRCRAVLGMDAWVEPIPDRLIAAPAVNPMLFMRSDGWRGTPNDGRLRGLAERGDANTYWIGIVGAAHNDFIMTPLLSPIAGRLGLKGAIPAARMVPIIDRFLVGFFDHTLLGAGPAPIEQNPYQEVSLEVIG